MTSWGLNSSSGDSNPALEAQIQLWRFKSSPGGSNPALEAQIQPWTFKSSSGASNPTLEAQIQLWRLKSSSRGSNPALEAQIQPCMLIFQRWRLKSNTGRILDHGRSRPKSCGGGDPDLHVASKHEQAETRFLLCTAQAS